MGSTPAVPPASPEVGVPSARELHAFLVQHLPIDDLVYAEPGKPTTFWAELTTNAEPFSDKLVLDLRGAYRKQLLAVPAEADEPFVYETRQGYLAGEPVGKSPTSRDLFQVAGIHMEARHRLDVCMRMAGVNQQTLLDAMDIEDKAEELKIRKGMSAFFNHPGKTCPRLPWICALLDVHAGWVEDGLKFRGDGLEPLPVPWWLEPWHQVCELATRVFDQADTRGLLPYREDLPGYDFAAFWSHWQAHPDCISIQPIWKLAPLHLLPWIFEARDCFRCGDLTYLVPFTPRSYQILRRMIAHYLRTQTPEITSPDAIRTHGPEVPSELLVPVAQPTIPECQELLTRIDAPALPNLALNTPDGVRLRLTPVQVAPPPVLDSRIDEVKSGRRPKEKPKP